MTIIYWIKYKKYVLNNFILYIINPRAQIVLKCHFEKRPQFKKKSKLNCGVKMLKQFKANHKTLQAYFKDKCQSSRK